MAWWNNANFSKRLVQALDRMAENGFEVSTPERFAAHVPSWELVRQPGIGRATLFELERFLAERGLALDGAAPSIEQSNAALCELCGGRLSDEHLQSNAHREGAQRELALREGWVLLSPEWSLRLSLVCEVSEHRARVEEVEAAIPIARVEFRTYLEQLVRRTKLAMAGQPSWAQATRSTTPL